MLQILERDHQPADVPRVIEFIQPRIPNLSLDLIFGVPEQTLAQWRDDLKQALLRVASNTAYSAEIRIEALAAIPDGVSNPKPEHLQLLTDGLSDEASVGTRSAAVETIIRLFLKPIFERTVMDAIAVHASDD